MQNQPTAAAALAHLELRAAEHESSANEEYQQYAAGLRDAIAALKPFLQSVAPEVIAYRYGTGLLHPEDAPVGEPDCEALGLIKTP